MRYIHLNKAASINLVTPQYVIVDGKEQHNPHVERNPKTKAIETVNIRKMGIGFSPIGNITVIDKTLFYNIYTYFIQSIQAKMKRKKWDYKAKKMTNELAHPDCAFTGTRDDKPREGSWAFFETVDPLGIWVNYEDPAIIECLEEHTQRQRFGDRIAQKIVERNILKDHPAIGITQVNPRAESGKTGQVAYVTVYGTRHEMNPPDLRDIMRQAEQGSESLEVKAEVIENVNPEEERKVIEEEETAADEIKPKPGETEPPDDFFLRQQEKEGK